MRALIRLSFFVCLFCVAHTASAATMYMEPNTTALYPGDTKTIAIRIDTDEDECINTVDGVLYYPDSVEVVDISRGDSILPLWVEEPRINTENRTVTFAGGIPNGYCGRIEGDPRLTNIILELVVQHPDRIQEPTTTAIGFSGESAVYLNNANGDKAKLVTLDANIELYPESNGEVVNEWSARVSEDTLPPNDFSISLTSNASIFNGDYFVTFNTADKQSGIDHYEIMEEPLDEFGVFSWGAADAVWYEARSPYRLKDQSLNSIIRVKAIDKAGNEYMAVMIPDEGLRGLSLRQQSAMVLGTLGGLTLLGLIIAFIVHWRRNRREEDDVVDDPATWSDEYDSAVSAEQSEDIDETSHKI